jgi:hypothetical protein
MLTQPTPDKTVDLRTQVQLGQLETLVKQGPATFAVSIINALIVYFILRDVAVPIILWTWTSSVIALNCLRLIMVIIFWRMPEGADHRVWTTLYLILIYCTGLGWGALPLFPAFYHETWVHGFIVFVIAGMSAGGIISLYVKLSAAIPYFLATILPMILILANGREPHHFAMAILSSLFLILLIRTTYSLNEVVRKTIRLEIENRDLLDFLVDAREAQDKTLTSLNS